MERRGDKMQITENYGLKKPESTDQYNIEDFNENMEIIDEEMNKCFLLGNEKREILASNLIAMGVEADVSESWDVLLPKVKEINNGVDTSGDTVIADVLVEGYTAHDANKNQITGTLPDKTGTANHLATASLDSTNSRLKMKVPALGRFGTGNYLYAAYSTIASLIGLTAAKIVKGNTILGITGNSNNMDTSGADATAAHVLAGKKVCVDGELFTGTMANRQGATVDANAVSSDDTYTYFTTPAGSYSSTSKIRTLNSNLGNANLGIFKKIPIYKNGDECTDVTGGWEVVDSYGTVNKGTSTITLNGLNTNPAWPVTITTKNKVNVSNCMGILLVCDEAIGGEITYTSLNIVNTKWTNTSSVANYHGRDNIEGYSNNILSANEQIIGWGISSSTVSGYIEMRSSNNTKYVIREIYILQLV